MHKIVISRDLFLLVSLVNSSVSFPRRFKCNTIQKAIMTAHESQRYFEENSDLKWIPLLDLVLNRSPEDLSSEKSIPRMAKSVEYARAIQDAWIPQIGSFSHEVICSPIKYADSTGCPLYGHLITSNHTASDKETVGIILFHTAAGPHDLFLHWKAHELISTFNDQYEVRVLIADLISDASGLIGWSDDRSRYMDARDKLLQTELMAEGNMARPILESRIQAAFDTINNPFHISGELRVSPKKLSVLGWCFGGQPVLEIVRCSRLRRQVKCAVTFHGVIDGIQQLLQVPSDELDSETTFLLCNGRQDPFVCRKDLLTYGVMLDSVPSIKWSLLDFAGVKHGFSNPAQQHNPNQQAFRYDKNAAKISWSATIATLRCSMDNGIP